MISMCLLRMGGHQLSRAHSGMQAHSSHGLCRLAGMLVGAAFVGVHMALTHGVTLGMVASYIPATEIKGIGRITGTCWSFTDFVFGERHKAHGQTHVSENNKYGANLGFMLIAVEAPLLRSLLRSLQSPDLKNT